MLGALVGVSLPERYKKLLVQIHWLQLAVAFAVGSYGFACRNATLVAKKVLHTFFICMQGSIMGLQRCAVIWSHDAFLPLIHWKERVGARAG